jgi:hypothetical protein
MHSVFGSSSANAMPNAKRFSGRLLCDRFRQDSDFNVASCTYEIQNTGRIKDYFSTGKAAEYNINCDVSNCFRHYTWSQISLLTVLDCFRFSQDKRGFDLFEKSRVICRLLLVHPQVKLVYSFKGRQETSWKRMLMKARCSFDTALPRVKRRHTTRHVIIRNSARNLTHKCSIWQVVF